MFHFGVPRFVTQLTAFKPDATVARVAVSIEVPLAPDGDYGKATRTVTRQRSSFTLGNCRYDLSRLSHHGDGRVEHQVEVELINLLDIQLQTSNAQALTRELEDRLVDLIRIVEPIQRFGTRLLRKRKF